MSTPDETAAIPPLRTEQLDFELPPELIATRPAHPRDAARMLVVHPDGTEHRRVADLPEYLEVGDVLIMNNTRVMPARIAGRRVDSGGRVEGLVLDCSGPTWIAMLKSNGRLREGLVVDLAGPEDASACGAITLVAREGQTWRVQPAPRTSLQEIGRTPLPPYILRARVMGHVTAREQDDRDWYQTTFASGDATSVAAPTAGLHFTPALLDRLDSAGIRRLELTLEVGPGTFKPVTTESLAEHAMHTEQFTISAEVLRAAEETHASGGRIFAVGTTTTRALESVDPATVDNDVRSTTDLMIAPGYAFRWVDGLLTNFHLPRSTLLALVAAKIGLDRTHAVYAEAIRESYRFYSYGDAMLIMPGCGS